MIQTSLITAMSRLGCFAVSALPRLALALALLGQGACLDPSAPDNLVPALVDEDPTLPQLELDQTTVHFEAFGDPDDPVIVTLHGGPGNDYRYLLRLLEPLGGPSLAHDYRWVFWDQRGAGLSQRHHPRELDLAAYLADLEQLIDRVAPGRQVILLGHSWGGQYAALYMNAHPERVAGAILAEPGRLRWDIEEGAADFDNDLLAEFLADFMWGRQFVAMADHARADYVASTLLVEQTNGREEDPSPNWRVGAAVILTLYLDELEGQPFDFSERLGEVEAPVLFLAGSLSVDLGAAFQTKQLDLFADASLVEIADAGHTDVVHARAEATVPVIRAYLDGLELDGARP